MTECDKSYVLDEKNADLSPSIVADTATKNRRAVSAGDLVLLSVDELWTVREKLEAVLADKIAVEMKELERRVDRLNVFLDADKRNGKSLKRAKHRRSYPEVLPKYRSPIPPFETWSGRGRPPRWLNAQLELGKQPEDFKI